MARLFTEQEFDDSANEDYLRNIVGGQTAQPNNAETLTGLYQSVFNRAPDEGGYNFWLNAMNTMGYTPEMVRSEFLKSPEYLARTAAPAPAQPASAG